MLQRPRLALHACAPTAEKGRASTSRRCATADMRAARPFTACDASAP
jgi:hypothetical protein